jgi:hypothetical protein
MERKTLWIEKQIEHHRFVLTSEFFPDEEKPQTKEELKS